MATITKTIVAVTPKGTVIMHSQNIVNAVFNTLPKGIPNLTQTSVPASLMLQLMHLPVKPAATEIKSGARAKRIMYK